SSSSMDSNIMAIDLKIMQSLKDIAGEDDEYFITEIIDNYLLESPEKLQLLINAIAENNVEELVKVAHGLGSSSISIGANNLAKICREIEAIAKTGKNVDSETIIPQLKFEYQQVEIALIKIKNNG
ncbi:MAG TPA: Hpt domain-containing protein, partial [Allocoleopsis sp.]